MMNMPFATVYLVDSDKAIEAAGDAIIKRVPPL